MSEILIKKNGVISMGSIDNEEDLKIKPGFNINPPPQDGKCECCGRHISVLKPYGGPGDPLVGDFSGAYLVKKFRPDAPYNEEAEAACKMAEECYESDGFDGPLDWMIEKHGEEKGENLYYWSMAYHSAGKSWECRDCAVLDTNEYFEKLKQSN
jgi:hypothetical protein